MHAVPLHLEAGIDVRNSLEQLAQQQQAGGRVWIGRDLDAAGHGGWIVMGGAILS